MSDETCTRRRLEWFADQGSKHAFRLRSGEHFLGWLIEVGAEAVLVSWAPSPLHAQASGTGEWSPPDAWIRFDEIDARSLAFWDDDAARWVELHDGGPPPS